MKNESFRNFQKWAVNLRNHSPEEIEIANALLKPCAPHQRFDRMPKQTAVGNGRCYDFFHMTKGQLGFGRY